MTRTIPSCRSGLATIVGVLVAGCWCSSPHVTGAPSTAPDEQFQTGTTHGYDVFLWHCVGGEHVAVWQASGEMFCGAARIEKTACGTPARIETIVAGESRRPIRRW